MKSKYKVAACLISGDAYHEDEIETLLKSLEPHVHGIFVAYNGQKDELDWQKYTSTPIVQKKFKWEDDFGKARNQSFSLVPRDEYDYWLWIDTDDELVVQEGTTLDEMFDSLDEYTKGVFIKYNYAIEPQTNVVVVEQWRERFLSTQLDWKWKWPIHEVCAAPFATQIARRDTVWINHQRRSGDDRGARDRNRRIIKKAIDTYPDKSRYVFYLAGETMAEADAEEDPKRKQDLIKAAIDIYNNFRVMRNALDEDVYLATCRIGELHRMEGEYSAALTADMEAIAINPDWPDGFVGAAKSCMQIGDWRRMKAFADIASKLPKPATAVSIESLNSSFTPIFLRGIANEELGEYDQALNDYKTAQKFWQSPNGQVEERIKTLAKYIKETKKKKKETDIRKQLRAVPGSTPEKSICFYTNPLPDTWHPEILKTHGAGGAETCIMELAPRFAADGWRVAVFGTPGEYRGVTEDGVEYYDSKEWISAEPYTVFVSSRSPFPFESQINAKLKLLWMHDVNLTEHLLEYVELPDRIITLSNWHKNHTKNLYNIPDNKLAILPNGINLDRFKVDRSNDPSNEPKFIWLSSPDRGLETLLALWPTLKSRYPDATLEVFYGWAMIDKIIEQYRSAGREHSSLENLKKRVETQLVHLGKGSGIKWAGRVGPDELAEALYRANFWLYPTSFMETFCISAIQAQAAGVIPIASNLAALTENIAAKGLTVEGWPANLDYQRRFLQTLDNVISDDPFCEEIRINARQQGRKFALDMSWDNTYYKWLQLFTEMGVEDKKRTNTKKMIAV